MITVEIDMDDVLLGTNLSLERKLHKLGYTDFKLENVKTYDFNKSLDKSDFDIDLGVPINVIMEQYRDIEVFRQAKFDEDALRLMKEMCRTGRYRFIVHTLSFTEEIDNFKSDYINNYFKLYSNVWFMGVNNKDKQALKNVDIVIEDCHLNLRDCSEGTVCYLVDKPYNQLKYNKYCRDILLRNNIIRVNSATEALEKIYSQKG